MNDVQIVDARGLSCPEPVLLAKQAINRLRNGVLEVLVDSGTARDNVRRVAEKSGWCVTTETFPEGGFFKLRLVK
jgi:TusA-related sulfurtransferase